MHGFLFELGPEKDGYYVPLSNICTADGRWDNVSKVKTLMKERGIKKMLGYSLFEVKTNSMHSLWETSRTLNLRIYMQC